MKSIAKKVAQTKASGRRRTGPRPRGLVKALLLSKRFSFADVIAQIQSGLHFDELEDLRVGLDLPMDKLATRLQISKATLHRRKLGGKLDGGESDRVVRFARLMGKAAEVLESPENARKWLNSPQVGLGGAVPLDYAETEVGAREVEDLLGRIEYGVYS